jgi:predicted unusual protein kinase regulating ubiquinone biosynthesis (AarF/ABC1/UbiB family)
MLRRNFQNEPRVVVPQVVAELVTRRVLVLEYVEGTRIDRLHERLASGELDLQRLVETVVDAYIKMMLEDGVFHADPHAGNLLIDRQGRLVLLDFGMVLQVERDTRRRLVETVLAAARQDVDGVINGFYELGILDPDVDRGTVRDAAQSLMAVSLKDETSPRQIQRLVEQVLNTFYEWPLMLPSNLVYFGRAGVLVEGIGLRYDPNFNALAMARPVLDRSAKRLIRGVLEQDPRTRVTDWTQEAFTLARTLRDLVRRVERDELRVRWHPRDTLELQRFLAQQVRRALLALFAFTVAVIASVVYLATRRLEVLVLGLLIAFGMFFVIFLLPTHLFQNPLRFRRRWPAR